MDEKNVIQVARPVRYNRKGYFKGELCLFTHRDPKTGKVYTDDVTINKGWIDPESVKWV